MARYIDAADKSESTAPTTKSLKLSSIQESIVNFCAHRHLTPDISTVTNDFINLNDQRRRIFGAATSCVVVMQ